MRYFIAAVSALALACTSATDPVSPVSKAPKVPEVPEVPVTPPAVTPVPPFTVTGSAAWTLALTRFSVQLFRGVGSNVLQYVPEHLELTETGGKSSASLIWIDVDVPGGQRDGDCTDEQKARGEIIGAGGTRDFAVTMGYCVPYATSHAEVSQVSFTATFADDHGKTAQVQGAVSVAGCTLGGKEGLVSCK